MNPRHVLAATLLGDVISSRDVVDQTGFFKALDEVLAVVNEAVPSLQPLQLMTGDEFQGAYEELKSALKASLLLRLHLLGLYELRVGLGFGEISFDPDRTPSAQSGPGWWSARQAINEVAALRDSKGWPKSLQTRFNGTDPQATGRVNGFLICRDQILKRMDASDARITLGLFAGETQEEVAEALDIQQSTVSLRQRSNGPSALFRSQESFAG